MGNGTPATFSLDEQSDEVAEVARFELLRATCAGTHHSFQMDVM